ncbi:Lrp/AsnC ligand binding domain-containing protein [Bradyrhizobium roseum]|uniref:Lrp/AsnC ligand binding domain-containing protein n=1 Tax=Bradyrhizobium roseum TaxID=3056648 RepID=UPI00261E317A|nr:Lrp/AsnC ligand binding domain-containing protein [Bradyrhizobium roseus]WKA31354.1 Lrp/AsnC ligand binding domain-containing protein [Bradyrhizobium roseus]
MPNKPLAEADRVHARIALAEIPEVMEAYLVTGDYDYLVKLAVRDTDHYDGSCGNRSTAFPEYANQGQRSASERSRDRYRLS